MKNTNTKAVLLVGGLGTRLRAMIPSTPKPLAPVGNRPFLELLLRQLAGQEIRQVIMCTGYLAEQIEREFGNGGRMGVTIEYSRESQPLGTGGAIKLAERFLQSLPYFLVMNGDSFMEIDFRELIRVHRTHGALVTIAVVPVENASRYGTVLTDANNRVVEFCEKTGHDSHGLVNAGVYVFSPEVLQHIPCGAVNLEKGVFPKLLDQGVYAAKQQGVFIDIGTPADYALAQQLFERMDRSTLRENPGSRQG